MATLTDTCDPRMAALEAVYLVNQVLDEAYVIANAVNESGDLWRHMSIKPENMSHVLSKGECYNVTDNKEEYESAKIVATSTPQKISDDVKKAETSIIGQGDEDFEFQNNELRKSTSMFINKLFDMSEVERVICDDNEILHSNLESNNELLTQAISRIMDSYVNTALNIAFGEETQVNEYQIMSDKSSKSTDYSGYSFLTDALSMDLRKEITLCPDDVEISNTDNEINVSLLASTSQQITELLDCNMDKKKEIAKQHDVGLYENAYLSLNRDYDQCSDEEGYPVLQDPKGLSLHEVELLTAHTSDDNLSSNVKSDEKSKELAAISAVSATSRKSTWSRCRTQGARLFACLRGWWRRKMPRKHKQCRIPGSCRGLCPLSPEARRRAFSLNHHRGCLSSPSPSRSIIWKFNTVNETLVNSSHWKDYTFEINPNECD